MIATHYILVAVPGRLLADAVAMACRVGPAGAAEAGSFTVALVDGAGEPWRGMCTAADMALIVAINTALAGPAGAGMEARWATVRAGSGECIAGSPAELVGMPVDWDAFLGAAGLALER